MDIKQPPMPLDELVAYLKRNEWQLPMLPENARVTVNAKVVYSCLAYLAFVKKTLDEQATRRQHPELPSTDLGDGPTGQSQTSEPQDGVGLGGAASGHAPQQGVGATTRMVGPGLGAVDGARASAGTESAGGGRPAGEVVSAEDNGGAGREGRPTNEGGVTTEREFNSPASETSYQGGETDSLDNLVASIERQFYCRNGEYSSTTSHREERVTYVTLGFITEARIQKSEDLQTVSDHNVYQRLRKELLKALVSILEQFPKNTRPVLYWRYARYRRIDEDFGHSGDRQRRARIMTRIAVPGVDWDKVHGFKKEGEEYISI